MYAPLRIAVALAAAGDDVRFSTTTRSPVLVVDDPGYAIRTRIAFPAHDDPADGPGPASPTTSPAPATTCWWSSTRPPTPPPCAPDSSPRWPRTPGAPRWWSRREHSRTPARPRVRLLPARRGRLAAHRPVRRRAGGADRGARGGHPERRRALRRVAARRVPARRGVPAALPRGAGGVGGPDRAGRRRRHRAGAGRTRARRRAGVAGPGGHPGRRTDAPLGRGPARARRCRTTPSPSSAAVASTPSPCATWPRTTTRPTSCSSTAGPARARSPASWRRRCEGTAVRPRAGGARRPGPVRAHLRHPRRLPHPLRLPQLHRVRARVAHRAQRPADPPRHLPRREVLRRARPRGRLRRVPRRRRRAVPARRRRPVRRGTAPPTTRAWASVEQITAAYGIDDVNLVKPGVGETTRVLLRRVPWKVLVRADAPAADLAHVRLLADQRGVPVEEVPELAYSCVGLIHPHFTRGATGADGRAVRVG